MNDGIEMTSLELSLPKDIQTEKPERSRRCVSFTYLTLILTIALALLGFFYFRETELPVDVLVHENEHESHVIAEDSPSVGGETANNDLAPGEGSQGVNESDHQDNIETFDMDHASEESQQSMARDSAVDNDGQPKSGGSDLHDTPGLAQNGASAQGAYAQDPSQDGEQGTQTNPVSDGGVDEQKQAGESEESNHEHEDVDEWNEATVTLADGVMYEVVARLYHDSTSFLEGLTYADGYLFESSGMTGHSLVQRLNPEDGTLIESVPLPRQYFGEGLAVVDSQLHVLTYKKKTMFVYDAKNFSVPPRTFDFSTTTGQGWGFTYDEGNGELIVSDGSEFLHFWDAQDFSFLRKVAVTRQNGRKASRINELEWWRGRVIANVWFKDIIIVINPTTGEVEKEYDFQNLWPKHERGKILGSEGVLNGISISPDPDLLYVTGKYWDRMFLVRLLY